MIILYIFSYLILGRLGLDLLIFLGPPIWLVFLYGVLILAGFSFPFMLADIQSQRGCGFVEAVKLTHQRWVKLTNAWMIGNLVTFGFGCLLYLTAMN
ncbi:hypothetical protein [Marinobacterium jannaschii]|uniref:hypothetical protein n=1 Tax=Marinobacterium jannaschii TaxID=64970 RepID=UPI000481A056|nr:hypothetical protein [Marinobacterium jannaschii]